MNALVEKFWNNFIKQSSDTDAYLKGIWAFGNSESMADELAALTLAGVKTATSSAYIEYILEDTPIPQSLKSAYEIILDGKGEPAAVIRITDVYVVPFLEVSSIHAFNEGEGDRSLEYWRKEHRYFWGKAFKERNLNIDIDAMDVVCESFEVVWSPKE